MEYSFLYRIKNTIVDLATVTMVSDILEKKGKVYSFKIVCGNEVCIVSFDEYASCNENYHSATDFQKRMATALIEYQKQRKELEATRMYLFMDGRIIDTMDVKALGPIFMTASKDKFSFIIYIRSTNSTQSVSLEFIKDNEKSMKTALAAIETQFFQFRDAVLQQSRGIQIVQK